MSNKEFKKLLPIILTCFGIISLFIFVKFLAFDLDIKNLSFDKHKNYGAELVNNSNQEIKVVEANTIKIVYPYSSSKDSNVVNVEKILIEQPISFDGKHYDYGNINLCAKGSYNVNVKNNLIIITPPAGYQQCKNSAKKIWQKDLEL